MKVTLKGEPVELAGVQPNVGDVAPDFDLLSLKDERVSLTDLKSKPVIISVVPDIDTSICALQTKRFNQEASSLTEIHFVTISNNTKEQLGTWCAAEGVEMTMLRDESLEFGERYGLVVPAIGKLARAIFVVDRTGNVVYEEIVPEISQEPDYNAALVAAKKLI
ncbi:MAG: thiol peroxidase [Vagococcus sp.]